MKYTIPLILLLALLQGCVTPPRSSQPDPVIAPAPIPVQVFEASPDPLAEQKLREANDLYDRGDYVRVISILIANRDIWNGTVAQRMQGHKLLAFSYCLTKRQPFCEQQFAAALRLDPQFELKLAERNHPQWGPAFDKAKGTVLVPVERPVQSQARSNWSSSQTGNSSSSSSTGNTSSTSSSGITINVSPGAGVDSAKSSLPQSIPVRIN